MEASLVDIEPADDAARRDLTEPEPAAPGVPSHRDLNPIFSFSRLKVRLPQDVEGCVAYMLSSMGGRVGDTTALAARHDAMRGQRRTLLVEKTGMGRTECFAPVMFEGVGEPGTVDSVNVTGKSGDQLLGGLCR